MFQSDALVYILAFDDQGLISSQGVIHTLPKEGLAWLDSYSFFCCETGQCTKGKLRYTRHSSGLLQMLEVEELIIDTL